MPATAKMAMFFRQIVAVFLVRTRPASSMAKPAAIHITRKPPTRNEKVLKMKAVSAETSARAGVLASATAARARLPAASLQIGRAHVWTPVTNAHLVCRLLLEKKKKTIQNHNKY